tara:strand:- start:134 stop:340 length:207 start_codon:yes stop_codon:yes gene_type:complete
MGANSPIDIAEGKIPLLNLGRFIIIVPLETICILSSKQLGKKMRRQGLAGVIPLASPRTHDWGRSIVA